jgi:hypothetical protein
MSDTNGPPTGIGDAIGRWSDRGLVQPTPITGALASPISPFSIG